MSKINWNVYTSDEARAERDKALQELKDLGYDTSPIFDPEQCPCCMVSALDAWGDARATAAWERYETLNALLGDEA